VLVGPRIARTGASERGAIIGMWQRSAEPQGSFDGSANFKRSLTVFRHTG
jgi:hypothetical protein